MSNVTKSFHVPTYEEVRAIELAARREQAEEMLRVAGIAVKGLKTLVVRAVSAVGRLRQRPRTVARHGT